MRLTPKGGADAIEGVETLADGRCVLKVRVRAAPSGNEANRALEILLAKAAGVARTAAAIVAGGKSRLKTVRIEGDASAIAAALREKAAG